MECLQLIQVRREVRIAVRHALTQQRQRGDQPARSRIRRQFALKWLCVDGAIEQVCELRSREEQQSLFAKIR